MVDLEHLRYHTFFAWSGQTRVFDRRTKSGEANIRTTSTNFESRKSSHGVIGLHFLIFGIVSLDNRVEESWQERYLCFFKCYSAVVKPTVEVRTDITCLLNVFRTAQAASITNHKTAPMLFWGSCALEHSCCSLWFMSDNMRWDGRKSGLEWTRKSWSSVVFFGFLKIVGLWSVWLK